MNAPRAALAATLIALAALPAAAAGHGRPDCPGRSGEHRDDRYARAVMHAHPTYYWRLGAPGGSPNLMGDGSADATYGTQVTAGVPGAIACSGDVAVGLTGAIPDGIWESHVVAGQGAHTLATGNAHFGIEIWARPDTLDGNSRRLASRERPNGGYLLAARSDALVFSRFVVVGGVEQWNTLSVPPLPLHMWSYVVANFDPDGVMRLYVNGVLAGQRTSPLLLPPDPAGDGTATAGRFVIGANSRLYNPANPAAHAFQEWDGALDEAAFYGPAASNLTPHEIRRHWRIATGEHGGDLDR